MNFRSTLIHLKPARCFESITLYTPLLSLTLTGVYMTTLTLKNAEQKDALVQAVAYMNDYINDTIGDRCRELEYVSDTGFGEALKELDGLRKRLAFTAAFSKALNDVPVGIS